MADAVVLVGQVGRRFWLQWLLMSMVGGAVGLALGDFPSGVGLLRGSDLSDESGWTEGWAVVVGGILAGAVWGSAQALVLRRVAGVPWRWVIASVAGFAASFLVVWAIGGAGGGAAYAHHALPHVLDPAGTPGGAIVGLTIGAAQWLVLRRQHPRAAWWVPVNAAGFVLGWLAAVAIPADGPEAHVAGGAAFGAAYGALTGSVLLWRLARARRRGPARAMAAAR